MEDASYIGKIIEGGRVTVPEAVRQALKLKQEDIVQVHIKKVA